MKFSIVTGLNEGNISESKLCYKFTDLCELLKPMGYKGIELAILEPEKIPVQKIKEIADSYEMEIPALGTGSTYLRFGYSFGDVKPKVRKKAINRIKKYIEFATVAESRIIIGLIRGRRKHDNTPDFERKKIIESLKICSKLAEENKVELLFEPINSFEIDSFNNIKDSLELISQVGSNNLRLMIDSFHIHLEEDPTTIWNDLEINAEKVAHIHLADDTRRAPGTGHFDFKRLLEIFEKKNYRSFASIETIMKPSFEEVAKKTMEYMKSIDMSF